MSPLTVITSDGLEIVAQDGPPWIHTPEGFNTWLSTPSVPLANWPGAVSYQQLYKEQPWVAAVVNKLARQIARLPLKVYELDSQGERARVTSGRLWQALEHPAQRKAPIDLKQWLAFPVLLHGNSVTAKVRSETGGPTTGFERLEWPSLEAPNPQHDHWIYRKAGEKTRIFQPADVVHIAWLAPEGEIGISPLEQLGVTLQIEDAAQRHQRSFLRNGVRPSGVVKTPQGIVLDPELRAEIRRDIAANLAGPERAGNPVLLPGGVEWEGLSFNAQEAELIEQRRLTREEVAAVYDVPPPMIGILDKATYSNINEQHRMLFTTVLAPWLVLVEEQLKAQAIDGEHDGQWVEFDLRDVLRGDPVAEANALKTQVQSGLLTLNEARAIMNRAPIDHPNADRPMIPTNNVGFIGDELADEQGAVDLADRLSSLEGAMGQVSPDFKAALELAEAGA
jgi:HK97 family phage portal protein